MPQKGDHISSAALAQQTDGDYCNPGECCFEWCNPWTCTMAECLDCPGGCDSPPPPPRFACPNWCGLSQCHQEDEGSKRCQRDCDYCAPPMPPRPPPSPTPPPESPVHPDWHAYHGASAHDFDWRHENLVDNVIEHGALLPHPPVPPSPPKPTLAFGWTREETPVVVPAAAPARPEDGAAGLSSWMPLIIGVALAAFAIGVFLASRRAPNDDDEDDEMELGEMPPPDEEDDVGRRAVSRRAEPISGREHVLDELRD